MTRVDGPFYDDLVVGHVFAQSPATTLDPGTAAVFRSICGEHWAPGLDHQLAAALTGRSEPLVNPSLVLAMSIGASTVATRRVIANLFYRDVVLARPVHIGETLRTTTEVRALADASLKPGEPPRGKALLSITTTADDEVVLAFERCALLPCRGVSLPGHSDEVGTDAAELDFNRYENAVPAHWDLSVLGEGDRWAFGERRTDPMRDIVDQATQLVRLTHNLASVHRDATASPFGRRLVYGGHTISLAQASLERTLAGLAIVVGWHECHHTSPVFEGDLLTFDHTLLARTPAERGELVAVRVEVTALRGGGDPVRVLDWTPIAYIV
jgi:2-methylfumaryl-CoA hydratase